MLYPADFPLNETCPSHLFGPTLIKHCWMFTLYIYCMLVVTGIELAEPPTNCKPLFGCKKNLFNQCSYWYIIHRGSCNHKAGRWKTTDAKHFIVLQMPVDGYEIKHISAYSCNCQVIQQFIAPVYCTFILRSFGLAGTMYKQSIKNLPTVWQEKCGTHVNVWSVWPGTTFQCYY